MNNRDRNFTRAKMQRRMKQIDESVARYLHQLDSADRQEPSPALHSRTDRLVRHQIIWNNFQAELTECLAHLAKAPTNIFKVI